MSIQTPLLNILPTCVYLALSLISCSPQNNKQDVSQKKISMGEKEQAKIPQFDKGKLPVNKNLHVINVASGNWEPFLGEKLTNGGPLNIIVAETLRQINYLPHFSYLPWTRTILKVKNSEIPLASCIWRDSVRQEAILFGEPILEGKMVFLKRANDPWNYTGWPSLKGKRIGVVVGYSYSKDFVKQTNFQKEEGVSLDINLFKLKSGRIDLVLDDELVLNHSIQKLYPELGRVLKLDANAAYMAPCYLGLSSLSVGAKQLREKLDVAIKNMKKSAFYFNILKESGLLNKTNYGEK